MIGEVVVSSRKTSAHACREGCGACCIAPSISSPIPGMPNGKPAGVRCAQLVDGERCAIFGRPGRPACCSGLRPSDEMCGATRADALAWLARLEAETRPAAPLAPAGEQDGTDDLGGARP